MTMTLRAICRLLEAFDNYFLAIVEAVYIRHLWLPKEIGVASVSVWLVAPATGFMAGNLASLFMQPKHDFYDFLTLVTLEAFLLAQFMFLFARYFNMLGDRRRSQLLITEKNHAERQVVGYLFYSRIAYEEFFKFRTLRMLACGTLILSLLFQSWHTAPFAVGIFLFTMIFSYLMSFYMPLLYGNGYQRLDDYDLEIPMPLLRIKMRNAYVLANRRMEA